MVGTRLRLWTQAVWICPLLILSWWPWKSFLCPGFFLHKQNNYSSKGSNTPVYTKTFEDFKEVIFNKFWFGGLYIEIRFIPCMLC